MVTGLPELKEPEASCAECLVGGQHRANMAKKSKWRAFRKLELVHSDICGPINPTSASGNRYFITFIDDFTRKGWVYFLNEKSSAFDTFKKFRTMIEKESLCQISCLRTDRGGEFTSHEFTSYCEQNGIKRQLTAAYTPQQNGVAERKNRSVMDMARSLIKEAKLPKYFWPDAAKWAFYVLDRSPTVSLDNIVPEEAWTNVKPSVRHLKGFGCIAHMHVPDAHRKKLDDKSLTCIFLGISDESKAYKLYNPVSYPNFVRPSRKTIF